MSAPDASATGQSAPTASEVAERLTMALAEAGRPDLRGEVRACTVCNRPRAYVGPATDGDEDIAARAFAVVFRRPEVRRVGRRSTIHRRSACGCSTTYAMEDLHA